MEVNGTTSTTTVSPASRVPTRSLPPLSPPPPAAVVTPCAACKILRRKCADKCILAPYFPPVDPLKFTTAHKVFGASNIIKMLQELPESHRDDAVTSIVYEANARIRDPVYGCAGAICQLQQQVREVQTQLAKAKAELLNVQTQSSNLLAVICMEEASVHSQLQAQQDSGANPNYMLHPNNNNIDDFIEDSSNLQGSVWEPLWT